MELNLPERRKAIESNRRGTKGLRPQRSSTTPKPTWTSKVHTNGLENYWSLLKRALKGTYVSVEPFHLFRYLDEQTFRFNNGRDLTYADRFALAISSIVGRRLMYKDFIGNRRVSSAPICP